MAASKQDQSREAYSINAQAALDTQAAAEQAQGRVVSDTRRKREQAQEKQAMQRSLARVADKAAKETKKVGSQVADIAADIQAGHGENGVRKEGNIIRGDGIGGGGDIGGSTISLFICNNGDTRAQRFRVP